MSQIIWPEGKSFAFTVFDDTDCAAPGNYEHVYRLLRDNGLRTTKSVWPLRGNGIPVNGGATCEDSNYLEHIIELQKDSFEIGFHGTTYHSAQRSPHLLLCYAWQTLWHEAGTYLAHLHPRKTA